MSHPLKTTCFKVWVKQFKISQALPLTVFRATFGELTTSVRVRQQHIMYFHFQRCNLIKCYQEQVKGRIRFVHTLTLQIEGQKRTQQWLS